LRIHQDPVFAGLVELGIEYDLRDPAHNELRCPVLFFFFFSPSFSFVVFVFFVNVSVVFFANVSVVFVVFIVLFFATPRVREAWTTG
jgi:hypothetical protein